VEADEVGGDVQAAGDLAEHVRWKVIRPPPPWHGGVIQSNQLSSVLISGRDRRDQLRFLINFW
jgi:hypothetical protein